MRAMQGQSQGEADILFAILDGRCEARGGRSVSRRLIRHFGNLGAVLRAAPEEVAEVSGAAAAGAIAQAWVIVERLSRWQTSVRPFLEDPDAAIAYCRLLVGGEPRERLHALFLDKALRLAGQKLLQRGTVDHVAVYPREVLGAAIAAGAHAVVLVHNHPSGEARPSQGDIAMTAQLCLAARPLGIRIADHIIIGRSEAFSFRRERLIADA